MSSLRCDPTTPLANSVGHVVRIYGNVDGTTLTYPEGAPPGAPTTINAGEVVQIPPLPKGQPAPLCISQPDHCMTNMPFIVQGDQPFAVASFMVGGTLQMPGTDPTNSQGDPAMSMMVTPEQFRKDYTFLAPSDDLENFADVIRPARWSRSMVDLWPKRRSASARANGRSSARS